MGKQWKEWQTILGGCKITAGGDCSHEFKRCLLLGRKVMTKLDSILKTRDITMLTNVHLVKATVFSVVMYGCESWTTKRLNAEELMLLNCGVGEDFWESLDCKEIKSVNLKGNQSWLFVGRTDAKTEALMLWPSDAKSWLPGKDPDAGKDWRQEEKGTTEEEMIGQHHRLFGHEFEQVLEVGDGEGSLACCSPWGHKE